MFEISMDKRYDNFIATICNCATPTIMQTDEEFRYILFEVLSVDVFTVFSEKNLDDLIKEERIRPEDKELCLRIRVLFEQNENRWRNLGSVNEIQENRAFTGIRRIAGTLFKTYCGYSLLDSEKENKLWNKIDQEYQFSPVFEKTPYPWIQIPSPCRSFSVKAVWDDKQEALVNSFFDQLGVSKLNVLDWKHDCFSFCPNDFGKLVNVFGKLVKEYYDDERNCNVYFPSYYPNGDYYFFIDHDGKFALFGHPWLNEIVVYGQELIDLFESNKRTLNLGELFILRVDVKDDYTREGTYVVSDSTYEIACFGYMENFHEGDPYPDRIEGFLSKDMMLSEKHEFRTEHINNWEYIVNGVICDGRTAIRVGDIHIRLDSPVPGDLKDGNWATVHISRMDV